MAAKISAGANFGPKFTNFNILQAVYKSVDGHRIRADLIIPKTVSTGKAPIIARFHGGGLVSSFHSQRLFLILILTVSRYEAILYMRTGFQYGFSIWQSHMVRS